MKIKASKFPKKLHDTQMLLTCEVDLYKLHPGYLLFIFHSPPLIFLLLLLTCSVFLSRKSLFLDLVHHPFLAPSIAPPVLFILFCLLSLSHSLWICATNHFKTTLYLDALIHNLSIKMESESSGAKKNSRQMKAMNKKFAEKRQRKPGSLVRSLIQFKSNTLTRCVVANREIVLKRRKYKKSKD